MHRSIHRSYAAACSIALLGLLLAGPAIAAAGKHAEWAGEQLNGKSCEGGFENYGPYDYLRRQQLPEKLQVVERAHFTEGVETLTQGASASVAGDIHYTLKAWPNHHRALASSVKLSLRYKEWPEDSHGLPAECYLQRAMAFSPQDGTVYKLFGYYLYQRGHYKEAMEAYERAMALLPPDPMLQYNVALLLVEQKQYDRALELARPLYAAGLPLPGLKNKLIGAGVWEVADGDKNKTGAED